MSSVWLRQIPQILHTIPFAQHERHRSIAPWNPFRIIQNIPRFQDRGSSSSNFGEWIEDVVSPQICLEIILVRMAFDVIDQITNSSASSAFDCRNPWILNSKMPLRWTKGCPVWAWSTSSFSLLTSSLFCRSSAALLLKNDGLLRVC